MRHLRNHTKEAVSLYLDMWYKDADVCQCEDCKLDVLAIMLNQLPPKYIVTDKGALFALIDDISPQTQIDLLKLMTEAANIVKNTPRHTCQNT